MTKAYLTIKDYAPLGAKKGDLLVQSDESADEIGMDKLNNFKLLTEEESLELYKRQTS